MNTYSVKIVYIEECEDSVYRRDSETKPRTPGTKLLLTDFSIRMEFSSEVISQYESPTGPHI